MVFPIVKTVESALEILNISIEFEDYLGENTIAALEATINKYKHRNKKSVPKNINRYLKLELEDRISGSDLEVVKNRLSNLFDAVVPLQEVIDSSRSSGAFPLYGQAIHHSLRKIHNSLYEWECFEGIQTHRLSNIVQKIDFIHKVQIPENKPGAISKNQLIPGNGEARRILLEAISTLQSIRSSDLGHKLGLKPRDKIYFGLGEASHILYIHDSTAQDGFVNDSRKIIFHGHNAKIIPLMVNYLQDSPDDINTENQDENQSTSKSLEHVLTRRDFVLISRGLLKDLMIYSKISRDEGVDTKISSEKSRDEHRQSFPRIGSLWLSFFNLPSEILKKELNHANTPNTLIGVMLASIFAAFSLPIVLSYRSPNWIEEYLSVNISNQPELYLGIILFLLIVFIVILPIGFYIFNGLVFLSVRLFGGNEGFDSQTYLISIISVPISVLIILGLILIKIPTVGMLLGISFIILMLLYSSLLYIRVVKVVYSFTTMKATIASAVPAILVSIFIWSGIAFFILYLI